jgi:hypothetical protein
MKYFVIFLVLIGLAGIIIPQAFADANTEGIIIWGLILGGTPVVIGLAFGLILFWRKRK